MAAHLQFEAGKDLDRTPEVLVQSANPNEIILGHRRIPVRHQALSAKEPLGSRPSKLVEICCSGKTLKSREDGEAIDVVHHRRPQQLLSCADDLVHVILAKLCHMAFRHCLLKEYVEGLDLI